MNTLEKKSILNAMNDRLVALQNRTDRDFSGSLHSDVMAIRELKTWIGKIKRGEFDIKVWED